MHNHFCGGVSYIRVASKASKVAKGGKPVSPSWDMFDHIWLSSNILNEKLSNAEPGGCKAKQIVTIMSHIRMWFIQHWSIDQRKQKLDIVASKELTSAQSCQKKQSFVTQLHCIQTHWAVVRHGCLLRGYSVIGQLKTWLIISIQYELNHRNRCRPIVSPCFGPIWNSPCWQFRRRFKMGRGKSSAAHAGTGIFMTHRSWSIIAAIPMEFVKTPKKDTKVMILWFNIIIDYRYFLNFECSFLLAYLYFYNSMMQVLGGGSANHFSIIPEADLQGSAEVLTVKNAGPDVHGSSQTHSVWVIRYQTSQKTIQTLRSLHIITIWILLNFYGWTST